MTKLITVFYTRKVLLEHEAHFCLKFNNKLGTTPQSQQQKMIVRTTEKE